MNYILPYIRNTIFNLCSVYRPNVKTKSFDFTCSEHKILSVDLFTTKTFAVQNQTVCSTVAETLNFINSGHERVCLFFMEVG